MRKQTSIINLALVFAVLFGMAFKCGNDNRKIRVYPTPHPTVENSRRPELIEDRNVDINVEEQDDAEKPSSEEIKSMLEQKFTSSYEDYYWGEKNKVEFEWLAPIQIGGQTTKGSIPGSCWETRIDVKVTFTKQSSGETGSVRRGINGNPVKEGFCIWRNAYDEWDYLTYAP